MRPSLASSTSTTILAAFECSFSSHSSIVLQTVHGPPSALIASSHSFAVRCRKTSLKRSCHIATVRESVFPRKKGSSSSVHSGWPAALANRPAKVSYIPWFCTHRPSAHWYWRDITARGKLNAGSGFQSWNQTTRPPAAVNIALWRGTSILWPAPVLCRATRAMATETAVTMAAKVEATGRGVNKGSSSPSMGS